MEEELLSHIVFKGESMSAENGTNVLLKFLKGVSVSINAPGPAALVITWFICMTALGLFGSGPLAEKALSTLGVGGMFLIGVLGSQGFGSR